MVTNIHHVGIAVQSLKQAYRFWRDTLGLPLAREAEVPEQGVRAALLSAGETEIELLEPLGPDSPIGRFLAKRGEGLHHVCFKTEDVAGALTALRGKKVALLDAAPRRGPGRARRVPAPARLPRRARGAGHSRAGRPGPGLAGALQAPRDRLAGCRTTPRRPIRISSGSRRSR